jgi:predicted HTH transcriptional regulator
MALIDDLTRQITAEVHRALDRAIRQAIENCVVGNGHQEEPMTVSSRTSRGVRGRGKGTSRSKSPKARQDRTRTIINAVSRLGEASIEDVAEFTGLDKRGIGSSLHYLAVAGKLKQIGDGRYKARARASF